MGKNTFTRTVNDKFILFTCLMSIAMALLYIWKGFIDGFYTGTYIYISLNLIYPVIMLVFKRKAFCYFQFIYSLILVFIIAFTDTYLYNNYSAFFLICIILLIKPQWKLFCAISYFITVTIAFCLNAEILHHYLIHIVRCIYFYGVLSYIIHNRFERKININKDDNKQPLELTDDEINILNQMMQGKKQKEVEGFSINTVTKKLSSARARNKTNTTQELLFKFIDQTNQQNKAVL